MTLGLRHTRSRPVGALTVIVTITHNLSPNFLQLNQPFRGPCLPVPGISRKSTDKLWSYPAIIVKQTQTNKIPNAGKNRTSVKSVAAV